MTSASGKSHQATNSSFETANLLRVASRRKKCRRTSAGLRIGLALIIKRPFNRSLCVHVNLLLARIIHDFHEIVVRILEGAVVDVVPTHGVSVLSFELEAEPCKELPDKFFYF